MKKIIFLFFTFLGNCTGFAQKPPESVVSDSMKQPLPIVKQPGKKDSALGIEKPLIRLFPNPARNKVEIELKGFEPGFVQVQLIDNMGYKVRDDKRLVLSGNEIIVVMFSEKPGLYILALKQHEKNVKARLVIQ